MPCVHMLFEDFTHVKFYRRSFFDVVEDEVGPLEGLHPYRRLGPATSGHRNGTEPAPTHLTAVIHRLGGPRAPVVSRPLRIVDAWHDRTPTPP